MQARQEHMICGVMTGRKASIRLVNSTEKTGDICPAGKDGIIYIICRLPIQKDTLPKDIEMVLRALEPFGFLNLHNPKHGIAFEIKG